MDSYSYEAEALATGLGVGFMLLFYAIFFIVYIAIWIAMEYPLYRMAKRQGFTNAWLAYIPFGNFYITLKLSPREFNLFNWFKYTDRTKAFWLFLIATGIYIVLMVPMILIFTFIPVLGWLLYIAYILAYLAVCYGIMWRMNYDLLITYGMPEHAMWASIVNLFCPILMYVFYYIIMNKEPDMNA